MGFTLLRFADGTYFTGGTPGASVLDAVHYATAEMAQEVAERITANGRDRGGITVVDDPLPEHERYRAVKTRMDAAGVKLQWDRPTQTPTQWHGSEDWPPSRWRASDGWRLNRRRDVDADLNWLVSDAAEHDLYEATAEPRSTR